MIDCAPFTTVGVGEGPRSAGPTPGPGAARPAANLPVWSASALRRVQPDEAERSELLALVGRAKAGELGAQSELVRRYEKRIGAFVRPFITQPSGVEDVVQMVLIKMVRRIALLRDPRTFESWLFTLARNTSLDVIRRNRCRPATVPDDGVLVEMAASDTAPAIFEVMEALELALADLGKVDREIVRLIVQGDSYRSIARRLGLSLGAVKVRLNRARKLLRVSVGVAAGRRLSPVDKRVGARRRVAA